MGKGIGRREPKHRRSGLRDQNQTTPEWQTSQSPCKRKMGGTGPLPSPLSPLPSRFPCSRKGDGRHIENATYVVASHAVDGTILKVHR